MMSIPLPKADRRGYPEKILNELRFLLNFGQDLYMDFICELRILYKLRSSYINKQARAVAKLAYYYLRNLLSIGKI